MTVVDDGTSYNERHHWRERAACLGADPELFVCRSEHSGRLHPKVQIALTYCQACPVRLECLNEAKSDINFAAIGVWGGEYFGEKQGNKNLAAARRRAGIAGRHRDFTRN